MQCLLSGETDLDRCTDVDMAREERKVRSDTAIILKERSIDVSCKLGFQTHIKGHTPTPKLVSCKLGFQTHIKGHTPTPKLPSN